MMEGEGFQASVWGEPSHYHSLEPPLSLSLDSLQDSDSDSLTQELEYQSALQCRISHHEDSEGALEPDMHSDHTHPGHLTKQTESSDRRDPSDCALQRVFIQGQTTDNGDTSLEDNEEEYNNPSLQKWDTSYSELLYDPDWMRKRGSGATATTSSQDLEDISDDSLLGYCTSPDKLKLKTLQNRAGSADKRSAGSTTITATRQNKPPMDPTYGTGDVNPVTGSKSKKKGSAQSQNSQKDILEKNKHTLGVRSPRTHSYLQLHRKNADKDTSGQDQKKDLPFVKKVASHMVTDRPIKVESAACAGSEDTEPSDGDTERYIDTSGGDVSGPPGHPGLTGGFISTYRVGGNPPGIGSAGPMGMNYGFEVPPLSYPRLSENQSYSFKSQAVQDMGDQSCSRPLHMDLWDVQDPPRQPHRVAGFQSAALEQTVPAGAPCQPFYSRALSPALYEANDYLYIDAESVGTEQTSSTGTEPDQRQINGRPHMDKAQRQTLINFLKQEVKLGGIGPSYSLSTERTEQLQKQKAYAKLVQEHNRELKPTMPEIPVRPDDGKKCVRQKGLEYAMKVPKPHKLPKISASCRKDKTPPPPAYLQDVAPQLHRIQELQRRHEREKVAVAAFNALHIL